MVVNWMFKRNFKEYSNNKIKKQLLCLLLLRDNLNVSLLLLRKLTDFFVYMFGMKY